LPFSIKIKNLKIHLLYKFIRYKKYCLLIGLILCLLSCNNAPSTSKESTLLPNTPETVSKQWQVHLDKNEIEKAMALSTTLTKEWLAENKELFLNDAQVYQTNFVNMECLTEGEKATCTYTILEEGELIEDFFLLKKINGQWLVDLECQKNILLYFVHYYKFQ